MPKFFAKFPLVRYDTDNKKYVYQNSQLVTNILFRVAMIREVLDNAASYFQYTIQEGDTPENLADRFYDDSEGHWVLLYANNIFDPQYDWPLDSRSFYKYMVNKYRAMAEAELGAGIPDYRVIDWTRDTTNANAIHHCEKVITRVNDVSDITDEKRVEIDYDKKWVVPNPDIPYENYLSLPETAYIVFNLSDSNSSNNMGVSIAQTITKEAVTYYDYEDRLNESKRNIKVIKKDYYGQIVSELDNLTGTNNYTRRLI